MSKRLNISLDDDTYHTLEQEAGDNKSAFICTLVKEYKRRKLEAQILAAMRQVDEDPEYMAEFHEWDTTLSDGLEDEDETDSTI